MGVSLSKNQSVSLSKEAGSALAMVALGVGWDVAKGGGGGFLSSVFVGGGGGSIDLDASAIMFDANRKVVDKVSFMQLNSRDGSVRHSGDNLTGEGDGDDETINIDLTRLPGQVEHIVLTVNSFRGQTFDKVANAYGRVIDLDTGKELAKYNISDSGAHTGIILASLSRSGGDWTFRALGERAGGRTVEDLVGPSANLI